MTSRSLTVPLALLVLLTVATAPFASGASRAARGSVPPGQAVPTNLSPPTVTGSAQAGSSLTGDPGTWSGAGVKLALQWERCDPSGVCAAQVDATTTSLALGSADVGFRFRLRVTATNKNGETSASSGLSGIVAPASTPPPPTVVAPAMTSPPTISGTAVQGQQLTAAAGSWSGTQPIAFAYHWHRCNSSGGGCAAIAGATGQSHLLGSADVGSTLRVVVTASNSAGSAPATSAATGVVASSSPTNPSPPAGCSAANPSACPASFFNGPLGANNLIPQKPGAFLIQWYEGTGCDSACKQAGILKRQADSGRIMDGVGLQANYGDTATGCTLRPSPEIAYVSWIHANGSFPVISWNPKNVTIGQINAGAADACMRNVAAFLKTYPFRIMLRAFWEFDGNWFTWSAMPGPANGNVNYCGQPFIDAWRRMVNIFKEQGASNVGFFWNPGEGGLDRSCSVRSYPGDAYVDWVGTEVYNFYYVGESSWGSPLHPGWAEFWELTNYTGVGGYCGSEPVNAPTCVSQYDKFAGGVYARKPMVTGETAVVYDPNNPSRKGAWYTNLVRALKGELGPRPMPGVVGIQFHDADLTAVEGPRANFRVDYPTSNASVYAGWIALARDPYFNTR